MSTHSLEVPRRGASNEYPQDMFLWRNKKNIVWIPSLICSYVVRRQLIPKGFTEVIMDCLQGHALLKEVPYDCFNFNFVHFLSLIKVKND